MGLPKKLTERQMKFAHEVVTNEGRKTATECARDAGFEPEHARQYASKLQNPKLYPLVVKYIGELREEWQKKYEVTYDRHISELAKLREDSRKKGAWSAAINAEVARGKAAGLYVDRKEILTGSIDSMPKAEVERRIADLKKRFPKVVNALSREKKKGNEREEYLENDKT